MISPTLISVIIPFLNGGPWLGEAIESVLSQSYSNWEIILIDDGSAEEHSRVAQVYSDQYPGKIIYTDHPGHVNNGVTISRNTGIRLAKGNYIAFLDADDYWLPQKLQYQLELFHLFPDAAMICESSIFWYNWEDTSLKNVVVNVGTAPGRVYEPTELIFNLYPFGTGAPPCPTGIIIKKEALDRSGGFEEAFSGPYTLYEDQAFLFKIYLREKVYVSAFANNMYRKRRGSLTESANDEEHYRRVKRFFFSWSASYLRQNGINNNMLLQLIEGATDRNEVR